MKNLITVSFLVVLITTIQSNPLAGPKRVADIYSSEDSVEILTIDNFQKQIENSSRTWFVKFYLSWCGHCQRLSLVWKDFARDIFAWRDLVQVAAMDCADELNTDVCRDQKVTRYPVLKYYPMNHVSIDVKVPEIEENVVSLRHHLLDRIIAEIIEGRGENYPNLLPYGHSDIGNLFDGVPKNTKYVFLVIEPPGVYLGAEVALDLHKTPNIVIKHAFTNNSGLVQRFPTEENPCLIAVDSNNNLEVISGKHSTRPELKESIAKFLQSKGMEVVEDIAPKRKNGPRNLTNFTPAEELREHVKKMGDVVFQKDLESALRYSLKQEVAISKIIDKKKREAFIDYLQILIKYFPFGYRASPFLSELMNLTSSETLLGYKIAALVKKAEENGIFSSVQGFLGCRGTFPRFRGYPCSLWKLFHYLTVNADNETNPREVLEAMHGYIKNFFSCQDCYENFQEMALRRNLTEVSSLDESILWLWKAHNEVNDGLKGDTTEDPEFPKEQFPTRQACPKCADEYSSWNEEEVLKYLKNMYSRFNVRYLGSNTRVLFEGLH